MRTNTYRRGYSIDEVAEMYGCSRQTIYNEMNKGYLPSMKAGDRRIVTPAHLDAWDAARMKTTVTAA